MRKLLSIILAITMIASFIPVASAAGETATDFTIKYDVSGIITKLGVTDAVVGAPDDPQIDTFADVFSETNTNGFFTWFSATQSSGDYYYNADTTVNPSGYKLLHGNWLRWVSTGYIRMVARSSGEGEIVFKVNVPVSGTYTMKSTMCANYHNELAIEYSVDEGSSWKSFGTLLGVAQGGIADVMNGEEKASVKLDGNSSVLIKFKGTNDSKNSSVGTFYLVSGDGSQAVIMNGKIAGAKDINTGESITLAASGYNSSTTEALTGWTYSTTDTDIVDVDATTGVVTAKAQGKATITATANGVVNAITTTINVTQPVQPGITVKYGFGDALASLGMDNTNKTTPFADINYNYTNGFISVVKPYAATSQASNYITYTNHLMMRNTLYIAFEIDVPVDGIYTMNVDHGYRKNGAKVNVAVKEGAYVATAYKEGQQPYSGSYDCNYGNANGFTVTTRNSQVMNGEDVATFNLKAGKHVVTFMVAGAWGDYTYGSVGNFTLVSGDGSQVAIVGGKFTGDTVVKEGKSVTLVASGYNSKTCEALTGWTYSTTDTDIVEVNATTGVVTAKAPGTATIMAKVNGAVNSVSTTVTVPNENAYTIKYDISDTIDKYQMAAKSNNTILHMNQIKFANTNDMFEVVRASVEINGYNSAISYTSGAAGKLPKRLSFAAGNKYVVFRITVPVSGTYNIKMNHDVSTEGGNVTVSYGTDIDALTAVGTYNCYDANATSKYMGAVEKVGGSFVSDSNGTPAVLTLEKGEYFIKFAGDAGRGSVGTFELISGNDTASTGKYVGGKIALTQNGLNVAEIVPGEEANIEVYGLMSDMSKLSDITFENLESSDPSILSINGNKAVAKAAGTATITATVAYNGVTGEVSRTIEVVPVQIVKMRNFYVDTEVEGTVTIPASFKVGQVNSAISGLSIKVTAAEDVEGYIFRGWKRGTRDNGTWISSNPELNIVLTTNTYLTAIYDVDVESQDEVTVEFYNENGQYLERVDATGKTFDEITPEDPTRPGFDFAFWATEKDTPILGTDMFKKLTRVVAQFAEREETFTVTGPDGFIKNDCKFNEKIEFTADAEGMWYVDGEPVAYGDSYTYYVWSNADVTYDAAASNPNSPIVSMDKDTRDGSYMIHFAGNGYSIVEAGIVFGTNATIESCFDRAASKKSGYVSGQFSASCDGQDARGYVIYRDGIIYRVAYTD